MINVSDTFKQKLQDGERVWQEVEITFPDGTVKTVKNEIMGENCTFSDCAESSSFPIGCVVCKSMTLELDNTSDQWKNYNFYMAKVHAYLKMQTSVASPAIVEELLDENYDPVLDHNNDAIIVTKGATADVIETIDKGTYTVTTPEQYGEIIKLTALDDMYKSNTAYNTKLKLPQTLSILVRDACDTLDIPMGFTVMSHGAMPISEIPENMTFRQFFGYVAMIECANARLNQKGQLEFVKWSLDKEPTIELFDYISAPTISSDDIVITGIEVVKGDKSELYGKTGYVLKMENDLVSDEDLATVAAQIGDSIIGTRFRNLQGESAFNPLLEFGDVVYSHDRKRNKYITPLTDVSYTINGKTSVKTQAEDPIRGMSQFVSEGTKAIAAARRLVQQEKTAREKALEVLGEQLKDATGVYTTEEIQEDGSRIFYLHDKPTLAESKAIWKMTSEAWGVSTDGGQTWNGGMTVDGDTIVRILTAVGLNADWINTGAITVKDADKNIIFQVDMDTKTVVIDPDVLIIGNMTLSEKLENMDENIASAKNMTFQLSNDMQTITSDADGNIPVFPTVATTAKVMYGSSDITNDCSYTITKSDSVTGSWDVDTHTYTVTGLSADNGWVDIKATYLINLSITKRFTISKQKSGKNGKQLYTWRKYASMPDGSDMSDSPDYVKLLDSAESPILDSTGDEIYTVTEAIFVGIADNKTTETPSDNPKDYIWSRFRGEDGADGIGIPGENGETSYIHTAYANSIDGTVDFSTTDTDRIYIGHYSDFEKTDSADPAKYTWARMRGEDGPPGRTYYLRANTEILLMGQDKKVSPEKLTVNVYYRDGQGEETAYAGWWKAERSSDSGKTWTTITLNQTEATGACTITSSLQIIGSRGMIRVTCYLDQAKTSIADMQTYSVALDVASLTQTEIVEILSDNGKWKGLYYKNGQLYISFSAALGGELTLGGVNNGNGKLVIRDSAGNQVGYIDNTGVNFTKGTFSGSLNSADGTFTGELSANTGNIAGWVLDNVAEQLISPNGIIILDAQNEEVNINGVTLSAYGNGLVIDGGLNIICGTEPFSDGTDKFHIFNLDTLSSGNYLRIHDNLVYMSSSSSKRYKILGASLPEEFIENLYNIEPIMARYKEGYLAKGDERVGVEFPMFIAEDVDKYFPLAVDHNTDGLPENWNERIMIPAMFAMIKSQKEQLDRQEKLINQLYKNSI